MKSQKINKKLSLNKETIAALEEKQLKSVIGGTLPTEMFCKTISCVRCSNLDCEL
jgi:natural product precursor